MRTLLILSLLALVGCRKHAVVIGDKPPVEVALCYVDDGDLEVIYNNGNRVVFANCERCQCIRVRE